jgi:hypothetical protein
MDKTKNPDRLLSGLLKWNVAAFLLMVFFLGTAYPCHAGPSGKQEAGGTCLPADGYEPYEADGKSFSVCIPGQWKKEESGHPYGDLTKISGVRLTGPKNRDGAAVTLSVLHYSGEDFLKTPKEFIRRELSSMVRIDHDQEIPLNDTVIAGRPGKKFQIRTFELVYLPARALTPPADDRRVYEIAPPHVQVRMTQQFIVVPAERGFYVLSYGAPEDIAGNYQDAFEKVTGSFAPRRP